MSHHKCAAHSRSECAQQAAYLVEVRGEAKLWLCYYHAKMARGRMRPMYDTRIGSLHFAGTSN
jgi:hypothetical protein